MLKKRNRTLSNCSNNHEMLTRPGHLCIDMMQEEDIHRVGDGISSCDGTEQLDYDENNNDVESFGGSGVYLEPSPAKTDFLKVLGLQQVFVLPLVDIDVNSGIICNIRSSNPINM